MKNDLDFKEEEMHRSKRTTAMLETEYLERQREIMEVNQLDDKVAKQIASLTDRIAKLKV